MDVVVEALPANRVALILLDRDAERITEFVSGGLGSNLIVRVDYAEVLDGLTGWAIREHQPVLSLKGAPDPREGSIAQRRRLETQCGSVVVVPVSYRNSILGTITAINLPEERDFAQRDADLVAAIASQVAIAIENTRTSTVKRWSHHVSSRNFWPQ